MATYCSSAAPQQMARIIKLIRIWGTVIPCLVLCADLELRNHYDQPTAHGGLRANLLEAGLIVPIVVLIQMWSPFKGGFRRAFQWVHNYRLMVSADAVVLEAGSSERCFLVRDIRRAEIPRLGAGLYLRTANRYRWLLIRKDLEDFSDFLNEIQSLGIPVRTTTIPPNWEEFVGVLGFCASVFCDVVSGNRTVLFANLILAILLGVGGWYVVSANPDNWKLRTKARIGTCLPAIFAAVALYFAS